MSRVCWSSTRGRKAIDPHRGNQGRNSDACVKSCGVSELPRCCRGGSGLRASTRMLEFRAGLDESQQLVAADQAFELSAGNHGHLIDFVFFQ